MSEQRRDNQANQSSDHLTLMQDVALYAICERYGVGYDPSHYLYQPIDGLPEGYGGIVSANGLSRGLGETGRR